MHYCQECLKITCRLFNLEFAEVWSLAVMPAIVTQALAKA